MPARFTVRLTPSFTRDLERLPLSIQDKILEAIKRLETTPFGPPPKIKKLKGKGVGQWRLEVWPYRVRHRRPGRGPLPSSASKGHLPGVKTILRQPTAALFPPSRVYSGVDYS